MTISGGNCQRHGCYFKRL